MIIKKVLFRKAKGGLMATIGFVLSPLSWWNDALVNLPLAYAFGFLFGLISQKLFMPMMIMGYWLTNVLGFMMMHHGVKDLVSKEKGRATRKELIRDIIVSMLYTVVVIVFIKVGWLKFPLEYFS